MAIIKKGRLGDHKWEGGLIRSGDHKECDAAMVCSGDHDECDAAMVRSGDQEECDVTMVRSGDQEEGDVAMVRRGDQDVAMVRSGDEQEGREQDVSGGGQLLLTQILLTSSCWLLGLSVILKRGEDTLKKRAFFLPPMIWLHHLTPKNK
jgi:hypothetical protein